MTSHTAAAWRHARAVRPLMLVSGLLLASCASRETPTTVAVAPAPPPATRPSPPAGASASVAVPPVGPDGRYRTVNSGISPAATIWHVRSALNVAALACRGPGEAALAADYNRMLTSKKALLAASFRTTEAETRARSSKDWRDVHDRAMTSVYNFFAQPPAKTGFCEVAAVIATEAAAEPAAGFETFSAAALPRLEAPFTEFYRRYDRYRRDLAAWEAGQQAGAQPVALARAAPPVVAAPAVAAAPVLVAAAPPPAPRLAYAPMDSVIGWSPAGEEPQGRLAATADGRPATP